MSSPQNLPSHLSERMFRRYESLIAEGLRNFPKATKFTPGPEVGLTTFTARFRDAIKSFREYGWASNVIDRAKFNELSGSFVVKHDPANDCCWFCKREVAGRGPAGVAITPDFTPPETSIFTDLTPAELDAFVLLIANRRIPGPILIRGPIDSFTYERYASLYDIGISYDQISDSTTIL